MSKLEMHLKLQQVDPDALARLATISSIYGILRVNFRPHVNDLTIEYDGTRLGESDVAAALARAGVPVSPMA